MPDASPYPRRAARAAIGAGLIVLAAACGSGGGGATIHATSEQRSGFDAVLDQAGVLTTHHEPDLFADGARVCARLTAGKPIGDAVHTVSGADAVALANAARVNLCPSARTKADRESFLRLVHSADPALGPYRTAPDATLLVLADVTCQAIATRADAPTAVLHAQPPVPGASLANARWLAFMAAGPICGDADAVPDPGA